MDIKFLLKQAQQTLSHNSPGILTAVGVAGTLTTAYLVGTATFKAGDILRDEFDANLIRGGDGHLEFKEKAELTWKLYIPSITSAALTVTAIVLANRIGTRRAAAVAAAYSLSERAYAEYREKVVEKMGEKKEKQAREEISQARVNRTPGAGNIVIADGSADVLCYDEYSGRYFQSNHNKITRAVNDINHQILHHDSATVSEFYNNVGLPNTSQSDYIGWNSKFGMLEIEFASILTEDNQPVLAYDFMRTPVADPFRCA